MAKAAAVEGTHGLTEYSDDYRLRDTGKVMNSHSTESLLYFDGARNTCTPSDLFVFFLRVLL